MGIAWRSITAKPSVHPARATVAPPQFRLRLPNYLNHPVDQRGTGFEGFQVREEVIDQRFVLIMPTARGVRGDKTIWRRP